MPKLVFFTALMALLFAQPALAAPEKYYVPPTQFAATYQLMDSGLANAPGIFQTGTGSFTYDADNKTISNIKIAIDANSMMPSNRSAMADLAAAFATGSTSEFVLSAPTETSFADNKAEIKGALVINGTSKPTTINATFNRSGKTPGSDVSMTGLTLRTSFKRSDYKLYDDAAPQRFSDEVTLTLELQAIRQ